VIFGKEEPDVLRKDIKHGKKKKYGIEKGHIKFGMPLF
jgi:hypothetical protein